MVSADTAVSSPPLPYSRLIGAAGAAQGVTKKVDLDAIPQVGGQSLLDFDLDATDKPWRLPGLGTVMIIPTHQLSHVHFQVPTYQIISTMASRRRLGSCTLRSKRR